MEFWLKGGGEDDFGDTGGIANGGSQKMQGVEAMRGEGVEAMKCNKVKFVVLKVCFPVCLVGNTVKVQVLVTI